MLINFFNYNAMKYYHAEDKSKGLSIVYSTRNMDCIKSEFVRILLKIRQKCLPNL